VPFVILEQETTVAPAWHRHYERLHLHTPKGHSALPHKPFPRHYPRYPSRLQVIEYLDAYARAFDLHPCTGERVTAVRPRNGMWETATVGGRVASRAVVVAAGLNARPRIPDWPDRDRYQGQIQHSSTYRNGEPFRGSSVLVVGCGNSGAEIAIDLWEHGARPSIAIRAGVNVIPRDLFGFSTVALTIGMRGLPPRLVDVLSAPLLRLALGNLQRYGLPERGYGPAVQTSLHASVPVLDVGTVRLVKRGAVAVRPGVERFTAEGVVFADGSTAAFDAVVLATGYTPGLEFLLAGTVPDGRAQALPRAGREARPGLFFCGFDVAVTGMLRQIGIEAEHIAAQIHRMAAAS
jgi:indole-3-pyruvate monooxygenase